MINEFREDLVSGEWVLFATGRAKRPSQFEGKPKKHQPKSSCPFEDPEKSGHEVLATYYNKDKSDWTVKIIKNKFPAVLDSMMAQAGKVGPFQVVEGHGRHEIMVFRDHEKDLTSFSKEKLAEILGVYQERYTSMFDHGSMKYILVFHNYGLQAGASIQHPHSQVIAIPILPPDVKRSINGAEKFYAENGKRIYDRMIEWEMKEKKRIVYENDNFVVFCPFVSKTPYETRIFPKESHAHFELMPARLLPDLADVMHEALRKISLALHNPDYNFFIHTSPLGTTHTHEFYTWHIEIVPKVSLIGGFELGSGVDVNIVDPDEAAKLFRETKI